MTYQSSLTSTPGANATAGVDFCSIHARDRFVSVPCGTCLSSQSLFSSTCCHWCSSWTFSKASTWFVWCLERSLGLTLIPNPIQCSKLWWSQQGSRPWTIAASQLAKHQTSDVQNFSCQIWRGTKLQQLLHATGTSGQESPLHSTCPILTNWEASMYQSVWLMKVHSFVFQVIIWHAKNIINPDVCFSTKAMGSWDPVFPPTLKLDTEHYRTVLPPHPLWRLKSAASLATVNGLLRDPLKGLKARLIKWFEVPMECYSFDGQKFDMSVFILISKSMRPSDQTVHENLSLHSSHLKKEQKHRLLLLMISHALSLLGKRASGRPKRPGAL